MHCVLGARPMRRGELRKKKKKDSKLFVKVVAPIKKYYVKIVKKKNDGVSIGAERGGGGEGVGASALLSTVYDNIDG